MDLFSSPPPLAPPTSEGNELAWLRLLRSRRVGPQTFRRLMEAHGGDAEAALAAIPAIARNAKMGTYAPCSVADAEAELEAGRRLGAVPLFLGQQAYPALLAEVPDGPPLLWARGDIALLERPALALVGARNASSLGIRMARALARGLGDGGDAIVSGLARGIDAEAHRAALDTGTVAVVAGGIDVVYPAENEALMAEIAHRGLILSEMPPGHRPQARHFPRRNRIVAGLARALVVVEAAAKSGSLLTAREAADLGRDVFAVPGHPFDRRAAGCNVLLRDGATLIRGPDDIHAALGDTSSTPAPRPRRARRISPLHTVPARPLPDPNCSRERVLELLSAAPVEEDQLQRDSGLPSPALAALLTELELDGKIRRAPGGLLSRAR
ncbi:MAG: DNA-processing protein DprA [Pseudomonadota bacterium]